MPTCATRGCRNEAPPRFSKCADCLCGKKKLDKTLEQLAAFNALPPLPPIPRGFSFRVFGSPMAWNNALVRPRHGRPYLCAKAKTWKTAIAGSALAVRPLNWSQAGPFSVEIRSTFARSSSDVDGPVKLVLDALQGVAYFNDKQVVHAPPFKFVDSRCPHLHATVIALPEGLA